MKNEKINYISKKHSIGSIAIGFRSESAGDQMVGEIVETYFTFNYPYRNYAARIRCFADGKIRSYQYLRQLESQEDFNAAAVGYPR